MKGTVDHQSRQADDYLPLVRRIARRVARRLPDHVDSEDLVGAGTVGLMEAMSRYRPDSKRNFETYAEFRVRGAIIDELRRHDPFNRSTRTAQNKIAKASRELAAKLGRAPERAEIAEHLQMDLEQLNQRLCKYESYRMVSTSHHDLQLMAKEEDQETKVQKRQYLDSVKAAILTLSEREQTVLNLYYVEELSQQKIGELFGVTESRICQVLTQGRKKMRSYIESQGMADG